MTAETALSIVVPVYNAREYLSDFFASIRRQTLKDVEVVAVDDGSTDGSGDLLDEMQEEFLQLVVIHQENSGWAGAPRNRGIERARGRYVFFADPDDVFGDDEALANLVAFADEHGSDVVVPKMVATGGRKYAQWRYARTQVDADMTTVFTTLTPQKLFRRRLLLDHDIRFPEGKVRLEDGIFLSRAYLIATRVSILADRTYYVLVHHDEGDHLSRRAIDPEAYLGSVTTMAENVESLCDDPATVNGVLAELVKRKVTLGTQPVKAVKARPKRLRAWFAPQRVFAERFLSDPRRQAALQDVERQLLEFARNDDAEGLKEWSRAHVARIVATEATAARGELRLRGTGLPVSDDTVVAEIVERDGTLPTTTIPVAADSSVWTVTVPKRALPKPAAEQTFDVFFHVPVAGGHVRRRVGSDLPVQGLVFTDDRNVTVYTTVKGNLSIRVKAGLSFLDRARRASQRIRPLRK